MPGNVYPLLAAFVRGEGTPYLHARTDIEHFRLMAAKVRNFIVLPYGGLERRSGTRFVKEVKYSDRFTRIIEFQFSVSQAYIIELGDYYARFYSNGGRIEDPPGTPVEVVTPWSQDQIGALENAKILDTLYCATGDQKLYELRRLAENSWTVEDFVPEDGPFLPQSDETGSLQIDGTGDIVPQMTSNVAPSGTASSDTASASAFNVFSRDPNTQYTVAAVSGWLAYQATSAQVCTGYTIRGAKSDGAKSPISWVVEGSNNGTDWTTLDSIQNDTGWVREEFRHFEFPSTEAFTYHRFRWFAVDSNLVETEISEVRFKLQGADSIYTTTVTKADGINGGAGFQHPGDIGRHLRLQGADGFWRWGVIQSVNSAVSVEAAWYGPVIVSNDDPLRSDATPNWRLGAWAEYPGFPARVNVFKDRLYTARTNAQPLTVWGSHSQAPLNYSVSTPLLATDAINVTIFSDEAGEIQWLSESRRDLLFSSEGAQRRIGPADLNQALSATNIDQTRETTHRAAAIRPIQIGGTSLFVSLDRSLLREFNLAPNSEDYQGPDLTVMSEHLFRSGIIEMKYQQSPYSLVWIPVEDGSCPVMTYDPHQLIAGTAKTLLGGSFGDDDHGHVMSTGVIANSSGKDETWMLVKRTIDGVTRQYVEYVAPRFEADDTLQAEFFDSALYYDGEPVTELMGFDHLIGETVGVLADGVDVGDTVVAPDGSVTLPLDTTASQVNIGLRYLSELETLRMPTHGNQDGSGLGRPQVVVQAYADLYKTAALELGTKQGVENLTPRSVMDVMDTPQPLVEGMHSIIGIDDLNTNEGVIVAKTDRGLPATIRAIQLALQGDP